MARILDGKKIARAVREEVAADVRAAAARWGRRPGLAVVLAGSHPASQVYVGMKQRACAAAGIASFEHRLGDGAGELELLELVAALNRDERVDGILVQLPLPAGVDESRILEAVDPLKDVDGFHPLNVGRLWRGEPCLVPCTPAGVIELLARSGIPVEGRHAVIVGRSAVVGRPLAGLFLRKSPRGNATVTVCHSRTPDIGRVAAAADILVAAIGRPRFITADMVREGAVVIDVGINQVGATPEGKRILVGDVDFEAVKEKAAAVTPVPGGVGPMTIAMLMRNTLEAFRLRQELR